MIDEGLGYKVVWIVAEREVRQKLRVIHEQLSEEVNAELLEVNVLYSLPGLLD